MKTSVTPLLQRIREYRTIPGNEAGGSLHIVTDDGNVKDAHVMYCIDCAVQRGDQEGEAIGRLLLQMTKTQRLKAYHSL